MNYVELKIEWKEANLKLLEKELDYGKRKCAYESLVDFKVTVKNGLFDGVGSAALQEVRATTAESYIVHLQGIDQARQAYLEAEAYMNFWMNEIKRLSQEMSFEKELLNKGINLGD